MFPYVEPDLYVCNIIQLRTRGAKAKFKIVFLGEADDFLSLLPLKIKEKIIYNISKSKFFIDPELFKKLDDTDIGEFRALYYKIQYRLLAC